MDRISNFVDLITKHNHLIEAKQTPIHHVIVRAIYSRFDILDWVLVVMSSTSW